MKRFSTFIIMAFIAITSFSQVNFWRIGYFDQFQKEKFDSLTFAFKSNYEMQTYWQNFYMAPTIESVYAYQKRIFAGLLDLGYTRHNDFGYASLCLHKESWGQDFIGPYNGYNWFDQNIYKDNSFNSTYGLTNHLIWIFLYKTIIASNRVLLHSSNQYEVAQAKAMRAFAYMNLAEIYQFSYGESTAFMLPCVPLVSDSVSPYAVIDMQPATIAQVYEQVSSDLDAAIEGLQGFERVDKSAVNQAVAYGLRARKNLITHNYEQAASDAQMALQLSGATPLSVSQAGVPGFADANAKNVIWANIIEENDDVSNGVVNWVSHLSTFYTDGYAGGGGATHWIASDLYDQISQTDVRKGWWLNANRESPLLDADGYKEIKQMILDDNYTYPVYTNVKFGTGDGSTTGNAAAAGDWILMRAEEMILIYAEALVRQGKDGASVLTDFVKTYRDPEYNINQHGLSVVDEIWWQRRVELWGEGFSYGDIMRLNKGVTRTHASNWYDWWQQDIPAGDERLILKIPVKDNPYRSMLVWHEIDNIQNPYQYPLSGVDSITFGEAKEKTNVYFTTSSIDKRIEKSSQQPSSLAIGLDRSHNQTESLSFDLEVVYADSVFGNIPTTVTFGENNTYFYLYVDIPVINQSGVYSFTLRIPDQYSPYGNINDSAYDNRRTFTYTLEIYESEWASVEKKTGVFYDGIISSIWSVTSDDYPFYVDYQTKTNADGTISLRIIDPFYVVYTSDFTKDEWGIYPAFPYNNPVDLLSEDDYSIYITINPDGTATVQYFSLGVDWGYGPMSVVNSGVIGKYTENKSVEFSAESQNLIYFMSDTGYSYAGFTLYFNLDAYLSEHPQSQPDNIISRRQMPLKSKNRKPTNSTLFKENTIEK